jgi:hypothetical protein
MVGKKPRLGNLGRAVLGAMRVLTAAGAICQGDEETSQAEYLAKYAPSFDSFAVWAACLGH